MNGQLHQRSHLVSAHSQLSPQHSSVNTSSFTETVQKNNFTSTNFHQTMQKSNVEAKN